MSTKMGAASLFIIISLALSLHFRPADSGYVITIPRRWTVNEVTQVCVSLTDAATFKPKDGLKAVISLTEGSVSKVIHVQTLSFAPGESNQCVDLNVPSEIKSKIRHYTEVPALTLKGTLIGQRISETMNVTVTDSNARTFVQTDKYLYKPGQTVQFRVLSVAGPFLSVLTDPLRSVHVETPSGTRIHQWQKVDNTNGLVHLSFQLSDEVDEGTYRIIVDTEQTKMTKYFKVEDYVLPRYEITIKPKSVILGSDKTVTIEMCAKYTFGEDVKGNATLSLAAGAWTIYANETQSKLISGCTNFTFDTSKLHFDDNNCHIRINQLKARAVVVEKGTGVELLGRNDNIRVKRKAITFSDESPALTKKPYMPRFVKIATKFADGKIAANEIMEVCTYYLQEDICKNFTTSNRGYLSFSLPADAEQRITVKAVNHQAIVKNWNDVMEASTYHQYFNSQNRYVDPFNSSLNIYDKSEIKCTNGNPVKAMIPVIYFVKNVLFTDVFVQVISRGQVQYLNKMKVKFIPTDLPYKNSDVLIEQRPLPRDVTQGVFEISLDMTANVSPKIKLLVWFTTPEGTIVADTAEIDVSRCLPHDVKMTWSVPKTEPGSSVDLSITGANNALCSVGIVDKSVELLSKQNNQHLQINTIMDSLYNYQVARWDKNQLNLEYCLSKYNGDLNEANRKLSQISEEEKLIYYGYQNPEPYHYRHRNNDKYEALHMFIDAGYYVFTDLTVQRQFCYNLIISKIKEEERKKDQEIKDKGPVLQEQAPEALQSIGIAGGFGGGDKVHASPPAASATLGAPQNKETAGEQEQERSYLPETWLWELTPLSAHGESLKTVTIPDTITEWIGRAVCVHPTKGVGISESSSVVAFKPFFVDLTLPATIKRGEILPLKISVFNYLDEDLPVLLTLKRSSSYETVTNVLNERNICVPAQDKVVETIKMTFIDLGDVNITVEASVDTNSPLSCGSRKPPYLKTDRLIRSQPVEAEGILRQKTWTEYVCAEDITDATKPTATWNIAAPLNIVEGSDRAWITATGDIMGPTLENIGKIIDQPSGCGEQNMVNFAPNVYMRQYLEASNQLTTNYRDVIDFHLERGYQRQLRYRHSSDGSFSTFGKRDNSGSTWLTAFVLKSFNQAKNYIYIEDAILSSVKEYLHRQQDDVTGCFRSQGRVIHKMLEGGLDKVGSGNVLLSAYVLAALGSLNRDEDSDRSLSTAPETISFPSPPRPRFSTESESIRKGITCIENDDSTHPYSLALRAYSLAQNNAKSANTVINKLLATAVETPSEMSWDLPESGKNSALKVETAAYALLALVKQDPKAYAKQSRKIVRWISGNRNSRGGFISTQDTVVALEALASFQKAQPSVEPNLKARVQSGEFEHRFDIMKNNKLLEQRVDLPTIPADVGVFVKGKGCGLLQGVMRYNVHAESPSDAFVVTVKTAESGTDCRSRRISACASYKLPDLASNMAIIEFKLQTGYTVDKVEMKKIVDDDLSGKIKRFELDGSKVIFYLEEISAEDSCISFDVYQDVAIENIKEGYVKVFDYYQPEYETIQNYQFPDPVLCNAIVL